MCCHLHRIFMAGHLPQILTVYQLVFDINTTHFNADLVPGIDPRVISARASTLGANPTSEINIRIWYFICIDLLKPTGWNKNNSIQRIILCGRRSVLSNIFEYARFYFSCIAKTYRQYWYPYKESVMLLFIIKVIEI